MNGGVLLIGAALLVAVAVLVAQVCALRCCDAGHQHRTWLDAALCDADRYDVEEWR